MKRYILFLTWLFVYGALHAQSEDVTSIIRRVNIHWQKTHTADHNAFWDNAVYHTGNIQAWAVCGDTAFLNYSKHWAEHNHWMGATEQDKQKWKYRNYGESQQYVLFGDWQCCFQTYLALPNADTRRVFEVMDQETESPQHDYWWWADALYMAMPVLAQLYTLTADEKYLDKIYENISYTDSLMYDAEEGLYYRDAKYVYPKHKTQRGEKDFWARGNGWVLAGLAKTLQEMPKTYRHYEFFYDKFIRLAQGAKRLQDKEGYWSRSMADAEQAPGPETSGTALFCYGISWGVNNGLLNDEDYHDCIKRAWHYLSEVALQPDNTIGYVQPIGERAIPGQQLSAGSVTNFGTGTFLLAACEYHRYLMRDI